MIDFQIYLLKCGSAKYVGSTNNFKRRSSQHLKDLKENRHANDLLQKEFNKGHKLKHKILYSGSTFFNEEVLRTEQRYINRYSNCNESVASKQTKYSRKEFIQDMLDLIVKNWKLVSLMIVISLTVGYGMTTEQANAVVKAIVEVYQQLGG